MNDVEQRTDRIHRQLEARSTQARREGALRYFAGTDLEIMGVDAPNLRAVVREHARELKGEPAGTVIELARALSDQRRMEARQVGFELLAKHREAFRSLTPELVRELGEGNDNWASVDGLACELVGPAWLAGVLEDDAIMAWARSEDLWWRRTAIVATTGLNKKSRGGAGDVARTLRICRLFVADRHKMISKAVSWALRELSKSHPAEVTAFVDEHEATLPAHVKREVRTKISKGTKR